MIDIALEGTCVLVCVRACSMSLEAALRPLAAAIAFSMFSLLSPCALARHVSFGL